jgi:outer membrane protein
MKTSLISLLAVCCATVAIAQQGSQGADTTKNVWTLKECVEYALKNNLTIKRGVYNVESAGLDFKQSRYSMFPNFNANATYGLNWGRSVNPVTYEYTTQELNSLSPGLSSSVTLFNGFRIQNSIKQYNRNYEAAEEDLQKTQNDVLLNIALFYINVIFNKEQLNNARFLLNSSQSQLERIKKQVAAGALSRSEELTLDAQVATNEVNVVNQENALNLSLLQLKQALQLPASTPLDVELMQVEVQDLLLDQSRDEIYNIARQTMPEIRSAKLKVESAYYAAKAAKGSLLPRLTLSGNYNSNYSSASDRETFIADGGEPTMITRQIGVVQATNEPVITVMSQPSGYMVSSYGYRDQLQDNVYRSLGLNLSIPIFNGMQSRYGWQRAVISREIAKISEAETENTLRQNVETAYNNAIAASKTYSSAQRQVAARQEAFRMMEQRMTAGAANSFEYQVSQNDLFRAQTDMTRAKYDFIFRKKVLDFYQGKPLDY